MDRKKSFNKGEQRWRTVQDIGKVIVDGDIISLRLIGETRAKASCGCAKFFFDK